MIDEVGTIWIVEKPRSSGDVIEDILYEDDISGLLQRARGGLISFHIYGIYKSKLAAERTAIKLIKSKSTIGGGWETTDFKTNQLYR